MGCLKLHTEENYTTLKVVYTVYKSCVLTEQEEKNKSPFLEVVYSVDQSGGYNWYTPAGRFNAVFGTMASVAEAGEGSFRLSTVNQGFSPKYYGNTWGGNQYAKTFNLSKVGKILGKVSLGLGVAMDAYGVKNYYNNPNSPNAVHPAKAGLNTAMGAYGLWSNPIAGALYFGVDGFYPGGWPAAMEKSAEVQNRDRAILGYYPKD